MKTNITLEQALAKASNGLQKKMMYSLYLNELNNRKNGNKDKEIQQRRDV